MLKKLKIKNFKSHKDTEFEFHPGINVFWGLSQAGKTNIIRALQLLVDNRPLGGKFLTDGLKQGNVIVEGEFYSGETVAVDKLVKVDKKTGEKKLISTEYRLNNEPPFSGVGVQVPDRIVGVLNISELNVQEQLSTPFLITESAGQVARTINKITRLEEVDEWVSDFTTSINSTNRDIVKLDQEIKNVEEGLKVYEDLDETEDLVQQVEAVEFAINDKEGKIFRLDELLERIEELKQEIKDIQPVLEASDLLDQAEELQKEIDSAEEQISDLEEYVERIVELKSQQGDKGLLDDTDNLIKEIEGIEEDIEEKEGLAYRLGLELEWIVKRTKEWTTLHELYEKSKSELSELLLELGKCPTCFGVVNEECVNRIIKEL